MLTVFKYPVPPHDTFGLELPAGAEILHFNSQNDKMFIWAKVDTDAELEARAFRLAGTGHDLLDMIPSHNLSYIGSTKIHGDALIFHLFEFRPESI